MLYSFSINGLYLFPVLYKFFKRIEPAIAFLADHYIRRYHSSIVWTAKRPYFRQTCDIHSPEAVYSRGTTSPGNRQRPVFGHARAEGMVDSQPPGTAPAVTDFLGRPRPRLGLLEGFDISLEATYASYATPFSSSFAGSQVGTGSFSHLT
jgi:hypothetical protein